MAILTRLVAGKKPDRKAREKVNHQHAAGGHPPVEVHDDEGEHEHGRRIGDQVPEIGMDEWGKHHPPQPKKFPGEHAVGPKIEVGERLHKIDHPHGHRELEGQPQAFQNPLFLFLHGAGIRFWRSRNGSLGTIPPKKVQSPKKVD